MKQKKIYVVPTSSVIHMQIEGHLLDESRPAAIPGGGNGGHVTIERPPEDGDDTDISGAKRWTGVWGEEY